MVATTPQVDHLKDAILETNHISEEQASHLPAGYNFRIPQEILQQMLDEQNKTK